MKQPIFLTNTLTKTKQEFAPITPGVVTMYHCGPTVYWNQHIGNMRSVVLGDIIRRTFMANGYDTRYVRNYTDVGHLTGDNIGDADSGEDRMAKGAEREGLTPDEIANKYIEQYLRDVALLNTLPATHAPRATDYINEMIDMVAILLEKGFAYSTPSAIYFDIARFPEYTRLSHQDMSELVSGAGRGDVADTNKRNPGDFSLWFFKTGAHSNALQTWPSPFHSDLVDNGQGFPGWHIECSAMIRALLGPTIDIHLGGIEHIPIHHTNEIAQSECCNSTASHNAPLATYWLHNEHLQVDSKKMSKSEGTSYLVSDILERGFDPLSLRYFFLQAHYRSQQNFTWDGLAAAETTLFKLRNQIATLPTGGAVITELYDEFIAEMNNDFSSPKALALVFKILASSAPAADIRATIMQMDELLGLDLARAPQVAAVVVTDQAQELLDARASARASKDWATSDRIRDELLQLGFVVKDGPDGQTIESA